MNGSTEAPPRVGVVGSGYVGTVVAACFAFLGRHVSGLEVDETKLRLLRSGKVPFHEPGLEELVVAGLSSGRLSFTDDAAEAVRRSDVMFLCVGTPGNGSGADLQHVDRAVRAIGAALDGPRTLVTKSTVPVGTVARLESIVHDSIPAGRRSGARLSLVSNPEFLRQGSAVGDFLRPERVVLGSEDPAALDLVTEVYRPILDQEFLGGEPGRRPSLVRTTLASAEAAKYAANAFLAAKISFINEIANICEVVGADVTVVAETMGMDPRISPGFLQAGVGWGGSCFGKDLDALIHTARRAGYEPEMLHAAAAINRRQRALVVDKLRLRLGSLRGRRITLLGLAFKPDTDDLRDAPSIDIAHRLLDEGADVVAYDPVVREVGRLPGLRVASNPYDAAADADAAVLVTEWGEFLDLDLEKLAEQMAGDLLLDGRNVLDPAAVADAGLRYEGVGRQAVSSRN